MAYCTNAEVSADFKNITFGVTGNVTSSAVDQFIAEADALINAYIGTVYTVPVTASGDGLNLLKLCSRSLVTGRIKKIMEVKQEKSPDASQNIVGVLLSPTMVMKILNDIQSKAIALSGAALLNSGQGFY